MVSLAILADMACPSQMCLPARGGPSACSISPAAGERGPLLACAAPSSGVCPGGPAPRSYPSHRSTSREKRCPGRMEEHEKAKQLYLQDPQVQGRAVGEVRQGRPALRPRGPPLSTRAVFV